MITYLIATLNSVKLLNTNMLDCLVLWTHAPASHDVLFRSFWTPIPRIVYEFPQTHINKYL